MASQSLQILLGASTALIYAAAIAGSGSLLLAILLGGRSRNSVIERIGLLAYVWLGFVLGQGVLSVVWLLLSLAGLFYPWPVWVFFLAGGAIAGIMARGRLGYCFDKLSSYIAAAWQRRSWYWLVGCLLATVVLFSGVSALLPTGVDDALRWYLVLPRIVVTRHQLGLFPFLNPYYGLHPLQVEMHWAALFAISNETAVTVWDYLCAMSFLFGLGIFARTLTGSRRVAVIAILMLLTTPGFYHLVGGGKPDNAAAQYGIAAFLCVVLWPDSGRRALALAGLCAGWSLACRYTNVFLVPALALFSFKALPRAQRLFPLPGRSASRKFWLSSMLVGAAAAALAVAPMLAKNWLLLGCPLAPAVGCQDMVWSGIKWAKDASWVYNNRANQPGISIAEVLSYPYVWTFAQRPKMLGNISPLFVGFLPFLFLYRRWSIVRAGLAAGVGGIIPIVLWWCFVNGLFPYTRWILLPLGLFAVCLSTGVVAAEQDARLRRIPRRLIQGAVLLLLLFLLFQSRGIIYAVRYAASIDSRGANYASKPGYDVAQWLNSNIPAGQRIAFAGWNGYSYFVNSEHLLNSESATDLEKLWQYCHCLAPSPWTAEFWNFYADAGFEYTVVAKEAVAGAVAAAPRGLSIEVAYLGRSDAVLKIAKDFRPIARESAS